MPNYKITIVKNVPGYDWQNVWGLQAPNLDQARQAAQAIALFEGALLWDGAAVIRRKVSPWPNPGGGGFVADPSDDEGDVEMTAVQPAEMCLLLNITALTGHPGRKWLRYSIDEGSVSAAGGKAALNPAAAVYTRVLDAAQDLETALDGLSCELLIGADSASARQWAGGIVIAGIGFRDTDIGWYNRETEG